MCVLAGVIVGSHAHYAERSGYAPLYLLKLLLVPIGIEDYINA